MEVVVVEVTKVGKIEREKQSSCCTTHKTIPLFADLPFVYLLKMGMSDQRIHLHNTSIVSQLSYSFFCTFDMNLIDALTYCLRHTGVIKALLLLRRSSGRSVLFPSWLQQIENSVFI